MASSRDDISTLAPDSLMDRVTAATAAAAASLADNFTPAATDTEPLDLTSLRACLTLRADMPSHARVRDGARRVAEFERHIAPNSPYIRALIRIEAEGRAALAQQLGKVRMLEERKRMLEEKVRRLEGKERGLQWLVRLLEGVLEEEGRVGGRA